MKHTRLYLATVGVPALAAIGAWITASLWSDRLPDDVTMHWSFDEPHSTMDLAFVTGLFIAMFVVAFVGSIVFTVKVARHRDGWIPVVVFFQVAAPVWPMALYVGTLAANLDVPPDTPASAPLVPLLVATVATMVLGWGGSAIAGEPPVNSTAGQEHVWMGGAFHSNLWWLNVLSAVVLLPAFLMVPEGALMPEVFAISALAPLSLKYCRVRVTVDSGGVTIKMGESSQPESRLPLSAIASASAGFWPTAGHPWRKSHDGVKKYLPMRQADMLDITLTNGSRVQVATVDGARGAAILNDLVSRSHRSIVEPAKRWPE